ncbi:cysteine proteinase [Coniochaeta ligniaria NRRL 30616]|uniref:Cysteine proteinase n=1 Tax=Coniochaeta ligniaria NRRL 30616 TaxID=1408157 RepID=A0A1J7IJV7_9PEZI|nr:cysteine proteinase [Coniochaeta ligniaria NRRL 30616]
MTSRMKKSTLQSWERSSLNLAQMVEEVYGNEKLISKLKKKFGPRPPKNLRGYWTSDQREAARDARNFLLRLLWSEGENEIQVGMKLAITKVVADMDAIYKQDIPISLVDFPGKYDLCMPGEWPPEILEEVPIEDVYIQPIIELQAPSRETPRLVIPARPLVLTRPVPRASPSTPLPVLPARSILKPETISFDFTPEAPRPNIRFSEDILSFRSPRHKPLRTSTPKPVKASRVEKKSRPSKQTQELWAQFISDIHDGRVKQTHGVQKIPLERPEDQTMSEACGGRSECKDSITGEMKSVAGRTKYEEFLDHTREELFKGGWVIRPTTDSPRPPYDGTMTPGLPGSRVNHDGIMVNEFTAARLRKKAMEEEASRPIRFARLPPKPASPKAAKTAEDVKRERDLLLHDLEVNTEGDLVRPSIILPDSELPIAIKKLHGLHIDRQLQEEAQAGEERHRAELARQFEEEKRRREAEERRKAEEERRRREEEERREAEERRRVQEVAAARSREEERVREAARRRAVLGLRRPTRAIITPLSDEWRSRVSRIGSGGEGVQLAKTPEGQALTKRDFVEKLLPPTAWLNDNVIIGSIQHIGDLVNNKSGATKENPRCATFTSYFWPRLETVGPGSCGRMMRRAGVRKDNFKQIETILIPICSGNHWTLAVVLPQKGAVLHMDSLRGGRGNPSVTSKILEWVKTTLAEDFVASEWSAIDIDGPAQTNGWDCGVFTIMNGLCMALGLDPKESYAAGQLRTARSMLAAILLGEGFKGDFALVGV